MTDIFASVRGRRTAPRIYPAQPLIDAAREPNDYTLMHRLGISGYTLVTARAEGLTEVQADTWAVRLGWHPSNIWPNEWWDHAPAWTDEELDAALEAVA